MSHADSNYQCMLVALSALLQRRLEMREAQLAAIQSARGAAVACGHTTETEIEKLEAKRLTSLNRQIASLGAALTDIATAAQCDHEAGK